jgi:hypothetical protein
VCQIQVSCVTFDVITVNLSSARRLDDVLLRMGSKEVAEAETKLLHLFAQHILSAPHRQLFLPVGRIVLCIPLVQGSYPAALNCCAFSCVYVCLLVVHLVEWARGGPVAILNVKSTRETHIPIVVPFLHMGEIRAAILLLRG